jgi:hypothetical protein
LALLKWAKLKQAVILVMGIAKKRADGVAKKGKTVKEK